MIQVLWNMLAKPKELHVIILFGSKLKGPFQDKKVGRLEPSHNHI